MGLTFNPFTGNFDFTGASSGGQQGTGGGPTYIDGEVATYADLPLDASANLDDAWLVRSASGSWLTGRRPAGIYIRTATGGSSRDADYTYAGIFPDVFSDANFTLYDNGDATKTAQFQLSGITTGTNRVVSLPDKNITLDDSGDSRAPTTHAASHAAAGSDPVFNQDLNTTDNAEFAQVGFGGDFTIDATGLNWGGQNIFEPETNTFYDQAGNTAFVVGTLCEFFKNIIMRGPTGGGIAELDADLIATGQTRNISFPDASGTLALVGDAPAAHALTSASHTAGNHKVFYSDGTGSIVELPLGNSGEVLTSNGTTSAPSFAAASGGVSAVGASAADILSVSGSDLVADDPNADRLVFWDDSASKLTHLEVGSGLSISGTTITATASGGSKTYAVFTATDNQPPASNYATLDTRNSIAVLDFDDATDESAVFVSIIPEGASLGSGLKIRLHWMATSATSGDCIWDVSLERMTTDLDSDSFDTIASGTAAANGTSGILTVTEITLTTIDGVTAGDGFRLKVTRDANNASDTMSGDAELVVVEVRSAA